MAAYRIRGLAKLITAMITLCKVIDAFGGGIRVFVPTDSQGSYDTALNAIKVACDAIRAINYLDTATGTNPPWGRE